MASNIRRAVVLGIVRNYGVKELSPFIRSLARSGYKGDICLFVDNLSPDTLEFLYSHRVQFQPLPTRYFVQARRHLIRLAADLLPRKFREEARVELARYYLHLIDARWPCYLDFLRRTKGLYSHVLFADVKDVVFQRDPFDFEWKAPLCSFYEPPGAFIRDESHTYGWIKTGFGAAEAARMADKRVICCGVTFAEYEAAIDYVSTMCTHLMRINARGLVDQGVHNYLLHHGLLKLSHVYDYPETPVLHLGLMKPENLALDADGLVVNGSGRVANVVHQYFDHRPAMARGLARMTGED